MNEIIYMKAGYEPWWLFSGWEEYIVEKKTFSTDEEARKYLETILEKFRNSYPHERSEKGPFGLFGRKMNRSFVKLVMMIYKPITVYYGSKMVLQQLISK